MAGRYVRGEELERINREYLGLVAERDALRHAGDHLAHVLRHEVMPRYSEMFVYGGLGATTTESVAVQMADEALAAWQATTGKCA